MRKFRTIFKHLVPSWLIEGDGERVLWTLAILKDATLERMRQGLEARMPTRAGPSALALLGDDRGIPRGRSETDAHYARRLIAWRYPRGHRVRGSAFALLEQIGVYWGGVKCWTISARGNLHERTAAGVESYSYGNAWDWDGAPSTPRWARFWVLVGPIVGVEAHPDFGDAELWSEDAPTVGQTGVTPGDVRAMRDLFRGQRPWKPAGTRAEWLIVSFDGTHPAPDATWAQWSVDVAGVREPSRDDAFRYIALGASNAYAGADVWPDAVRMPGGGTYAGADVWPASTTLPTGAIAGGTAGAWPATVDLIDDGDPAL